MSHLPLRGMVKDKVLDLFAQMYGAGASVPDLHVPPPAPSGWRGRAEKFVERLALR